jgi:hypothetical protein
MVEGPGGAGFGFEIRGAWAETSPVMAEHASAIPIIRPRQLADTSPSFSGGSLSATSAWIASH